MQVDNALDKTNRVNVLFDFYGSLLTEKQQTFLKCYYHDDYSLGEIAADFTISRQAVYEHLKRAELVLEEYESKLRLAERHERLHAGLERLEALVAELPAPMREPFEKTAELLRQAESIETAEYK
ncbi:YlxM family DNA-binding protein [Cohnella faecalis]|uniref:YlxM family DNA-binding protein n=1 Tax=Cohnella faecalis TaxID=2315694 RepID=UPI003605DF94